MLHFASKLSPDAGIVMNILLSLSPFIAFFALMRLVHPLAGLFGAFAVSLLLSFRQWRRGESVKVLEIGSLVLFGALVLFLILVGQGWLLRARPGHASNNNGNSADEYTPRE